MMWGVFRLTFSQFCTKIALHPSKCLKEGPVAPVWGCRTSTLHCIDYKTVSRYRGVAAIVSRVALHCATKVWTSAGENAPIPWNRSLAICEHVIVSKRTWWVRAPIDLPEIHAYKRARSGCLHNSFSLLGQQALLTTGVTARCPTTWATSLIGHIHEHIATERWWVPCRDTSVKWNNMLFWWLGCLATQALVLLTDQHLGVTLAWASECPAKDACIFFKGDDGIFACCSGALRVSERLEGRDGALGQLSLQSVMSSLESQWLALQQVKGFFMLRITSSTEGALGIAAGCSSETYWGSKSSDEQGNHDAANLLTVMLQNNVAPTPFATGSVIQSPWSSSDSLAWLGPQWTHEATWGPHEVHGAYFHEPTWPKRLQ